MMSPVPSSYNSTLVVLSVVIAIAASYTALDVAARVSVAKGRAQVVWLCCGAAAMGIGIWAMHFVGMLAFQLPFEVEYDIQTVAVSMLPAILSSGLALFLVSRDTLGWPRLMGGSLLMGSGIASMHYVGMAAMQMPATMQYSQLWVAVSVLIAIAVSFVGLFLVFRLRTDSTHQLKKRLLAAVAMGAAIPTMHYTGMAAAQLVPNDATADLFARTLRPPTNDEPLAIAVIVSTAIIFSIA
ncbi:MAG: MHYT domain-containing protein [Cyanobacteria bacterium J06560_6]